MPYSFQPDHNLLYPPVWINSVLGTKDSLSAGLIIAPLKLTRRPLHRNQWIHQLVEYHPGFRVLLVLLG